MADGAETASEKDRAYRRFLEDCESKAADAFDKTILWLSGGGLGISVAFMKDIVSSPVPGTLGILALSWFFLTTALILSLVSQLASMKSMRFAIECCDGTRTLGDGEKAGGPWRQVTEWVNQWSMITCIVGVVLLWVYALTNVGLAPTEALKGQR